MPEHYYIDGYNVLHRSSLLKGLARESLEIARDTLIDKVAQYCASSGVRATIVFDGRGPRTEHEQALMGAASLDIVYAAGHQSADAFIERTVYQSPNRREAVVVSGDRGITDLCIGMGALAMTPDAFLAEVADETSRVRAKVERDKPKTMLSRFEDGLDEETRKRLAELRDRLEGSD